MTVAEPELAWGDLYVDHADGQQKKFFSPHPGQRELLENDAHTILGLGGINSGKTSVGMLWLCNEIARHKFRGQYLVVATTFSVVLSSTYQAWMKTVRGWGQFNGTWHPHQTNPRYELDNGATVFFRSADAKFDGLKPNAILLDEGGDISQERYHKIRERMAQGCRLFITTTPYTSHDWIRTDIMEQADNGNPMYFYRCLPSNLNPMRDDEFLAEQRRLLPQWEWEMKFEGKFTRPPSLVYDFSNCYVDEPDELPQGVHLGGIDFGGNDPTAGLNGVLDETDCLWLYWEYYNHGQDQDVVKFIEDMREWNTAHRKATGKTINWFADHRPEIIRPLKMAGLNVRKANKKKVARQSSIEVGISLVNARIRTGRLKIIRGACPSLRAESLKYRYPTTPEGEPYGNIPIDKHNHALDALRYLVMGCDRTDYAKASRRA